MTIRSLSRSAVRPLLAVLVACLPGLTWGAIGIPQKGEGSVRFSYQDLDFGDQLFSRDLIIGPGDPRGPLGDNLGDKLDEGDSRFQAMVLEGDYGLSRHLAVSGSATYVFSKYDGPIPHGMYDDGSTHGTIQDASARLRYEIINAPISVTPYVGLVVPLRTYETQGLAAAGRGLNQKLVGLDLGWRAPSVPFEIEADYTYALVEELEGIDTDRWQLGLRAGYAFSERFSGSLFGLHRGSTGGLDLVGDFGHPDFFVHDATVDLQETRAGLSVTVAATGSLDVFASFSTTLSGENIQEVDQFALGASWRFGGNPLLGD